MLVEHNVRTGFVDEERFEAARDHLPAAIRPLVTFAAYLTGWRIQSYILLLECAAAVD